ncbi:MAG: single-stranded DNA-binding protein [Nitrospirae bacterium 13_2_20CM_2_63_8]|nr:MAG: single-stranded DNA-binding protein [Nitrospirae bacterium 13_2_20CM_2_63_8]TLY34953.1 MAG: single-stranded DNA-binding protein [Nitrospirota bacterium]
MAGFNKVILMGNLTRDPEIRYAPSGTPVANFGLAVNRRYRQGDETKEEVCFVDIVVFGRQAETCGQYLSKGNGALVEGRLQMRKFETKDGQKVTKHEVVAETVRFLPKRMDQGGEASVREPLDEVPPSSESDEPA